MFRPLPLLLALLLVLCLHADAQFAGNDAAFESDPQKNPSIVSQVEPIIAGMTLEQKVAQLFFVRAYGEDYAENSPNFVKLRRRVETDQVGGVIFFRGSIEGQVQLTNRLQSLASIPLLIAQDMEYGAAMRVDGATRLSPAMGVAATGNPMNAYWMGRITAIEAKALGVHQIYAPVVDVNNNPVNPVINTRSFSENPSIVGRYASEFIRGVASVGLMSTAKHFPGHGDTETDSHFTLPVIRHSYARLDSIELPPFRDAIRSGVSSIMSAHIAFPELSDDPKVPGTLDPKVLGRLLVDSLRYEGLIVSDALEMKGVTSVFKPGEAAVSALHAGIDLLILSPNEEVAMQAVVKAVNDGQIPEARIDASLRKLLSWKFQLGLFEHRDANLADARAVVGSSVHQRMAERIARESVTVMKNDGPLLPLSQSRQPKVLLLAVSNDGSGRTGADLATAMAEYHSGVDFFSLNPRTTARQQQTILQRARAADVVVVATYFAVNAGEYTAAPGPRQRFMTQIEQLSTPSVLLSLGSPYSVMSMPQAKAHVSGWSGHAQHAKAIAAALFGATEIHGKMPVSIPGLYPIGIGLDIPKAVLRSDVPEEAGMRSEGVLAIDRIMNEAIRDSVFPGGVVAVVRHGVLLHLQAYGSHTYGGARAYKTDDIFDMASLTKVMATTSAVMRLASQGRLDVDDRVSKYIPEYRTPEKQGITIRQMLLHEAGLPAFRVYVDKIKTRRELVQAVLNEPLINRPGTQYVYSDLGFITLAEIVERVTGRAFDEYVENEIFRPLNMTETMFKPVAKNRALLERIPPTEIDTIYRKKTIHGEVHDERAWYMDGLAGHAGLFSTAKDVARYATMLLDLGTYNNYQVADSNTVKIFTARQSVLAKRGYGFDMKSATGFSSAGTLMGPTTFGHTGFTGTCVWIDPQLDLAVVVLTNRTWPYRGTSGPIGRVRAAVADAAVQAIIRE